MTSSNDRASSRSRPPPLQKKLLPINLPKKLALDKSQESIKAGSYVINTAQNDSIDSNSNNASAAKGGGGMIPI